MTTSLILAAAVLAILAVLGAVACGGWLFGQVVGAGVRLATGLPSAQAEREAKAQELADMDQLIRDTRRMAGLPPLR